MQRLESVAGALLELSPDLASSVAAEFYRAHPEDMPLVLGALFSVSDLETAHRLIVDLGINWAEPLQLHIRGLILNDISHEGLLPCREQRAPSHSALELYERYLKLGAELFRREPVLLPNEFVWEKFMLMEVNDGLYLRAGGRHHQDNVSSMIRELLDCGQIKSACKVTPQGGGLLMRDNDKLILFGESQQYGRADMGRAQELLASTVPGVTVTVR